MNGISEGRLAAHRAYMILAAGAGNIADPLEGNTAELKRAMRSLACLEKRDEKFRLGFDAEVEAIRKDLYRLTGRFSWTQPNGTSKGATP